MNVPNILTVIKMYRELRGWSFAKARDEAIAAFRARGWPIPESIERLEGRAPIDFDKFRETL